MGTRRDEEQGFSTEKPRDKVVIVGVNLPSAWHGGQGGDADLSELERLVDTAGADVVGQIEQNRHRPVPSTFLGKGRLEDLQELVEQTEANLVVFDNDLSPAQGKNLEKVLEVNVIDRTELILDIFASHASTRQARLQVELAQLQYMLPRLTRLWSHLERQAGGIGTRGPGETQLETDRRLVNKRISALRRQLQEIEVNRHTQVRSREGVFKASLIGYTNAGKSTLMNGITDAKVYVKDQLFATLDATTRKVEIDERRRFLLTDTVGFIRRLPHHLVESFKATLQEVQDADLMLHVVEASSDDPQHQINSVNEVLREIVPEDKPTLMVFNKMDLVDEELFKNKYSRHFPEAIFISAKSKDGWADLRDAIVAHMTGDERIVKVAIPIGNLQCLSRFHRTGSVVEQTFEANICHAVLRLKEEELNRLLSREGATLLE